MAPLTFVGSFLAITTLVSFSSADSVPFSYAGANGPENWGTLSSSFSACSSGQAQSPINIVTDSAGAPNPKLTPLTRDYKPANATLVNNGFNIGVKFESDDGTLVMDGLNYTLKQMHWHTPSEHQIDGKGFAAELHLIHKSDSGSTVLVSILYALGDPDPFIAKIQTQLTELAKEKCSSEEEAHVALGYLDNKLLRKNTRKYYRYIGSLTAPPCTENVTWSILGKVRSISQKQVDALKAPLEEDYKCNSRPVQPLNGRKVDLYDELNN